MHKMRSLLTSLPAVQLPLENTTVATTVLALVAKGTALCITYMPVLQE